MLGLYVFVFGYIFGGSFGVLPNETQVDYGLGIFLGLTMFQFFSEIIANSTLAITTNPNLVKKVVFPLEILPAAAVGGAFFHLLISFAFVLIGTAFLGPGLSRECLWLPLIMLPTALLSLGVAWLFAAFGVFFRDLGQMIQFLSMALMFSSAVFYSASHIPAAAWQFLRFNPVLIAIEMSRNTALWHLPLNMTHYTYLWIAGLTMCYFGHFVFRRLRPAFADVL